MFQKIALLSLAILTISASAFAASTRVVMMSCFIPERIEIKTAALTQEHKAAITFDAAKNVYVETSVSR